MKTASLLQMVGRIAGDENPSSHGGRILIVDNFKNVAYPYTSVEDADKKVQELLSALGKNDQDYFRDILNLDPGVDFSEVTARELENAEPEGIMIAHEIGSQGISMWYDTAGRETVFREWPDSDIGEDWGEPIGLFKTEGQPDGTPIPMNGLDVEPED